jgi:release factor glutamine methyltransferase
MQARTLIREALHRVRTRFPELPPEQAFFLLVRLLADGLHISSESLMADLGREIPEAVETQFWTTVERWLSGYPLPYALGTWGFWDMTDLVVPPGVFIPRPETETLVEAVWDLWPDPTWAGSIVDVGTGVGALAIALARAYPRCRVWAVDISWTAVQAARQNAERYGVRDRLYLWCGHWLDATPPRPLWDLVIANPPYMTRREWRRAPPEVRDHEPPAALFHPRGPAYVYTTLGRQAKRRLRPGGVFVVEVGAGQAPRVLRWLSRLGGRCVGQWRDLLGHVRCVAWAWPTAGRSGQRPSPAGGSSGSGVRRVRPR